MPLVELDVFRSIHLPKADESAHLEAFFLFCVGLALLAMGMMELKERRAS